MKTSAIIHIRNGEIVNKSTLRKMFDQLKEKDGRYLIEAKDKTQRSLNQNAYYWAMMTDYIQPGLYEAGWNNIKSKEDAHHFCCDLHLKVKEVNEITGEERTRVRSTTELSKQEFNLYLEDIWQWAAEYLGINIPSPNSQMVFAI